MKHLVPVIDVFAGPGGLSEGFSAIGKREGKPYFRIALSIEKDKYAFETLLLRSFFRQFPHGKVPEEYYEYLRGEMGWDTLFSIAKKRYYYQWIMSRNEAWHAALGSGREFDDELDSRIMDITRKKDKWVLIGGPPCQAYSIIGRARNSGISHYNPENDERTHLYKEYLKILCKHKPAIFLMENVKGILSSKLNGERIIDKIINDLENPSMFDGKYGEVSYRIFSLVKNENGYDDPNFKEHNPFDFVIECEKFGVPQRRHRVILLGIREDLCKKPRPGILEESGTYNLQDVIGGLPVLRSGLSREDDSAEAWERNLRQALSTGSWLNEIIQVAGKPVYREIKRTLFRLQKPEKDRGGNFIAYAHSNGNIFSDWFADQRIGGVCNHSSKAHMIEDIYRYLYASSFGIIYKRSPKLDEFPTYLLPEHENVNTGDFKDRFRVQVWDQPSTTVTSHLSKDGHYFIHPDPAQCRSLTVREAARLQTFPDNYFFCGGKTQQYKQVGNAVPPILAYKIAGIIRDYLERI